ncbi:MAG: lipopolysaccharide biosynthesis protein [Pirellulales bacterium]|nr:lipopolysaccharide biosynthesis protein [Pirellulales bacterium]
MPDTVELDEPILPPLGDECDELGPAALRADTLAESVVILLALTGVQRLVGFCRAVLFCRWLPPEELGQWDMAFSFLMLAAPLSMLALPACFGRYLEHYRQRGHLRTLLARTTAVVGVLVCLSAAILYVGRVPFARLVFGTAAGADLMGLMALMLAIIVSTHFMIELLTALRNVRFLAVIQFVNSVAFAALGAVLLLGWSCSARSVVLAYGGACLVSTMLAVWWLRPFWRSLTPANERLPQRDFWAKILPFVVWISLTNLTASLFEMADRYMIIHFAPPETGPSLAIVGQYHSSRVVPLLMVSIALMLGSMVTPHLSHDWEQGERERVRMRLNLFLKLLAFTLSAGAVAILLAAPLLFDWALAGKFNDGREVLPPTLAYCIWFGMTLVSQNYLFCAEKARLGSLALLVGLVVNVALNRVLLPRYGLPGAVMATAAANLAAFALLTAFNRAMGFRPDRVTLLLIVGVPALLAWNVWAGLAALVVVAALAFGGRGVLSPAEREHLADAWRRYTARFRRDAR